MQHTSRMTPASKKKKEEKKPQEWHQASGASPAGEE
jgi:hypothetical protein